MKTFKMAMEYKKKMLDRGLRSAKATCKICGTKDSFLMVLAGPKNHLHAKCNNPSCKVSVME